VKNADKESEENLREDVDVVSRRGKKKVIFHNFKD
jgi:hypothetical protein